MENEKNIKDQDMTVVKNKKVKNEGFIRKVDKQLDMINIIEWILKGYIKADITPIFYMHCPFCNDVNKTMKIDTRKKTFRCATCGISGGAVLFVMLFKKISLREALQLIADIYDIDVLIIPHHVLIRQR